MRAKSTTLPRPPAAASGSLKKVSRRDQIRPAIPFTGVKSKDIGRAVAQPAGGIYLTELCKARQTRALAAYRFDAKRVSAVSMPTLLLIGSDTASPHMKQAISSLQGSLPNPTLTVLEGQQHNAMDTARRQLAEAVTNFLLGTTDRPLRGSNWAVTNAAG